MRRVYHRFPQRIDLDFEIDRPFPRVLTAIWKVHNTHTTAERGGSLVKSKVLVEISATPTRFLRLDESADSPDEVEETADFRFSIRETVLKPEGRIPLSENIFLLRCIDRGLRTDCMVVKENRSGGMDALDFKEFIQGICR
ncbi:MAG: hypothetical protein ACXQTN_03845 [Methanoculleaceae archaeon]